MGSLPLVLFVAIYLSTYSLSNGYTLPSELGWIPIVTASGCEAFTLPATGLPSDAWRPIIYTKCCADLPSSAAPCVLAKNLVLGEEWAYPRFKVRIAGTVNARHRRVATLHPLFRNRKSDWTTVKRINGRNYVYKDTAYRDKPKFASWDSGHCTWSNNMSIPFPKAVPPAGTEVHDCVAFLGSPQSGHFQHFLDRVSIMYTQAEHLLRNCTTRLTLHPVTASVAQLWEWLDPIALRRITQPQGPVYARHLVFPCNIPVFQPYTILRSREIWLEKAGIRQDVPLHEKKKVLLLTRRGDPLAFNGRDILNFEELEKGVQELLASRGLGEVLEVWDYRKSLQDTMRVWATEVAAVIGIHGGAIYNQRWLGEGALLLEIWPVNDDSSRTRANPTTFYHARALGLQYWVLGERAVDEHHNIQVDVASVIEILSLGLGKPDPNGPGVIILEKDSPAE